MDRLTLFWVLIAVSTLLFLVGLGVNVSIWFGGSVPGLGGASRSRKLAGVLSAAVRLLFSRKIGSTLRALVVDGILHPRLRSESGPRWFAHTLLSLAFLVMFALSLFTGFFEQGLHNILGLSSPLIEWVISKDTPVMAALNEGLGVLLVLGLALLLVRRYVQRPSQLRTSWLDTWSLLLLGLGLLTSYPVEALRFLAEGAPASGSWASFVGYPLYLLLTPLAWPWAALHTWMFFAHVLPFMALLVYMPWSKFLHVLVGPFVAAADRLGEEEVR